MEIRCLCGELRARISGLPRSSAGRFVCYCDDCQAYAHSLGRAAETLDPQGGSEIVPVHPWMIEFVAGRENLRCRRLGPKGLYRFYSGCCQTPLANTMPNFPWAGLVKTALPAEGAREEAFGKVRGRLMGKHAIGGAPPGASEKMGFREILKVLPFILRGFLFRRGRPSPFFDPQTGRAAGPIDVLSREERERLRALCGPRPSAAVP